MNHLRNRLRAAAAIVLLLGSASCSDSDVLRQRKPGPDTPFKIVILGASTAKGQPYERHLNIGSLVEFLFDGRIAAREVEVVNLALPGILARQVAIAAEDVDSSADVVFLYTGNNEFLGFSGSFTDVHAKRRLFDRATVNDKIRTEVLKTFYENLETAIAHMRKIGVPLVLSTLARNESDWGPNRSYLRDPKNEPQVARLLADADTAIASEDFDRAVSILVKALELEPTFAWTNKRLADAYRALGRYPEAKRYYRNAIDYDGYPIRALTEQNDGIRELARTHDLPLVDAEKLVAELSPTGLVGYNLIWDNCHPVLEGYLAIAEALADRIEALYPTATERTPRTLEEVEEAFGLERLEARIYSTRGQYIYGTALFIWDPTARLDRAQYYLDTAKSLGPPTAGLYASMAIISAMREDPRASIEHWKHAFEKDPKEATRRFENKRARAVLESAGVEAAVTRIQQEAEKR